MNPLSKRGSAVVSSDERGAALILAIGVMLLVGLISAGLLGLITTSVTGRSSIDALRDRQYDADSAIERDIVRVRGLADPGVTSCGGPQVYAAYNAAAIRVECQDRPVLVFDQATASLYLQRNVVFNACLQSDPDPCASPIASAQVNFVMPPGATVVSRTYVQSWSVNQ